MIEVECCAGFLVKTCNLEDNAWLKATGKVFLNFCHSKDLPAPNIDISKEELLQVIHGHDIGYRIPLSLSDCKHDKDKSGNPCVVIDVAVNFGVYQMAKDQRDFCDFLVELGLSWVEQKYGFLLSRKLSFLKIKAKGALSKHKISKKASPKLIEEVSSSTAVSSSDATVDTAHSKDIDNSDHDKKRKALKFESVKMIQEPPENPEYLILNITCDNVDNLKLELFPKKVEIRSCIKEKQLEADEHVFVHDLSKYVNIKDSGAQFNHADHVLTITMPVLELV